MAETTFQVFLSCCFAEEDKEVIDFFKKIIVAFNMRPLIYDYQEIGRLTDTINKNIKESDCLIAIATKKDKIEGTDHYRCSDWIQQEIALAYSYGKPIAIFVEEGVKIEGLIEKEERRERFNRRDIMGKIDKIIAFLYSLRKSLDLLAKNTQEPILLRHFIYVKEIFSNDFVIIKAMILMESLIDGLEATFHLEELEDLTPGVSIKPIEFDFKCYESPPTIKVEHVIEVKTDYKFFWKIKFTPPLRRGDIVRYAFKTVHPNERPYTYEELKRRIEQKSYEYKEEKIEACRWSISHPTYELRHEMEFPDNYEIEKFSFDVLHGEEKFRDEKEVIRIEKENMFTQEKLFDKWILKLHVHKPLLNRAYKTYYVPCKA